MSEDRWDRLAKDLQDAGFEVHVDRRSYTQVRYGRVERGVSSSVTFQVRNGSKFLGVVTVSDKYGRSGQWYGWSVTAEGADSIIVGRPSRAGMKRSETVSSFRTAVATLEGRSA